MPSLSMSRWWLAIALVLMAAAGPASAQTGGAPTASPATGTGTIRGTIAFRGTPPAPRRLDNGSDPFCARSRVQAEDIAVNKNSTLRNVLVRLVAAPGRLAPPRTTPAAPAVIDQVNCVYRPRVQGIVAGQTIVIKNSDNTLHNVHTYRGTETVFNVSQIPYAQPTEKKLSPGAPIRFGCDMHPWMIAWVVVTDHPFFAVSGTDGTFTIPNVPAGTWKLEAWHEKLGVRTVEITVPGGGVAEAAIAYEDAPAAR